MDRSIFYKYIADISRTFIPFILSQTNFTNKKKEKKELEIQYSNCVCENDLFVEINWIADVKSVIVMIIQSGKLHLPK